MVSPWPGTQDAALGETTVRAGFPDGYRPRPGKCHELSSNRSRQEIGLGLESLLQESRGRHLPTLTILVISTTLFTIPVFDSSLTPLSSWCNVFACT